MSTIINGEDCDGWHQVAHLILRTLAIYIHIFARVLLFVPGVNRRSSHPAHLLPRTRQCGRIGVRQVGAKLCEGFLAYGRNLPHFRLRMLARCSKLQQAEIPVCYKSLHGASVYQ